MHSSSREPPDDLAELRRLINQPEQEKLRELRDRLDDKEQRAEEVATVLPEALALGGERRAEMIGALQPLVEASVRESIAQNPEALIEALRPIIGSVIRRAIADRLRRLRQSLAWRFSREGRKSVFTAIWNGGRSAEASRRNQGGRFALAAGAGLIIVLLMVAVRSELRWRNFVRRLNAAPGIAVLQAEKGWVFRSRVAGLRDPAIADPVALARAAGIDPASLRFFWKDYLALDDASVLRRFEKRFGKPPGVELRLTNGALTISGAVPFEWIRRVREEGTQSPGINSITQAEARLIYDPELALERFHRVFLPPPGVTAKVANRTLFLSGTAPYEWLALVRDGASKLPGIETISDEKVQVVYDIANVLQRFSDRFNLPDTVQARMEKKVLVLSGEAPHAWLTRVRRGAASVPGIDTIDEQHLIDLDQSAFQQSKAAIESTVIPFPATKDSSTPEGAEALARLPDEIQRCLGAATRLGLDVQLEVRGYADSVGNEQKNFDLSQRRADAVCDFLVKRGFKPSFFHSMGMGAPPEGTAPGPAGRQIVLRIVPKT